MVCTKCGNPIDEKNAFCGYCGSAIDLSVKTEKAAVSLTSPNFMLEERTPEIYYCSYCAGQISETDAFCEHCGTRTQFVQAPVAPKRVNEEPDVRRCAGTKKPVVIGVVVLLLVAVTVLGYGGFSLLRNRFGSNDIDTNQEDYSRRRGSASDDTGDSGFDSDDILDLKSDIEPDLENTMLSDSSPDSGDDTLPEEPADQTIDDIPVGFRSGVIDILENRRDWILSTVSNSDNSVASQFYVYYTDELTLLISSTSFGLTVFSFYGNGNDIELGTVSVESIGYPMYISTLIQPELSLFCLWISAEEAVREDFFSLEGSVFTHQFGYIYYHDNERFIDIEFYEGNPIRHSLTASEFFSRREEIASADSIYPVYIGAFDEVITYLKDEPAPQYNEAEIQPIVIANEFIFIDSHLRYITRDELEHLTGEELWKARNEIYARHGRDFSQTMVRDYFESLSWYQSRVEGDAFDAIAFTEVFNAYEIANITLIREVERSR